MTDFREIDGAEVATRPTDAPVPDPLPIDPDQAGAEGCDASHDEPVAPAADAPKTNDQLGTRTARGALVTLGGLLSRIVLQMASVVVLARLLDPRAYGLLALVLVVVGVGEILRDFGLSTASIQAKSVTHAQRDNLFWLNSAFGLVLGVVAFAIAPLYARLFGQPPLEHMVEVLALVFVINGVAAQFRADLNRRLKFGKIAIADVLGSALGLVVGIVCAVLGAGYWSLVAQQLTQFFVAMVVLVVSARWIPARPDRSADVRPLIKMGSNLAATRIIYYFMNNLDTLTIGFRFSSVSLGLYNRAFQLMNRPLSQMLTPATTVALPVLSRLQDDVERSGDYLKRAQLAIGYTVVPLLAFAAGASTQVVAIMLGSHWTQVVPIFALLAVAGCLSTLAYVGRWVYLSRGLASSLMRYTMVSFVLQFACILIGSIWGVVGVAWGYMIASALEWPLSLTWLSRLTVLPLRALLHGAGRICLTGGGAGVVAFAVSRVMSRDEAALVVLAAAAAVAVWYLGCAWVSATIRADLAGVSGFARMALRRKSRPVGRHQAAASA